MQNHPARRVLSALLATAMLAGTILPLSVFAEGTTEAPQQEIVLSQETSLPNQETSVPEMETSEAVQPETVEETEQAETEQAEAIPETQRPETAPAEEEQPETSAEAGEQPQAAADEAEQPEAVLENEPEMQEEPAEPETLAEKDANLVEANILRGLVPTSNAKLSHPEFATDNDTTSSDSDDGAYTAFAAGEEDPALPDNGYENWNQSYLQYDFGKLRDVQKVEIYRNTYSAAHSTFKDVKVELSETPDFQNPVVIFNTQDVKEENRGEPQVIALDKPVKAQYIRVWQKGHYIENDNGGWKGMSSACRFTEVRVMAMVDPSEVPVDPPTPPVTDAKNIALGKLPYVYGLYPTNLEAITDGKVDDNFAVHNSKGNQFLQFEYRNSYDIKQIKFKLEEGLYKSVKVEVSKNPKMGLGKKVVFNETNWTQGAEMVTVDLSGVQGSDKRYVRFTVNRADDQPTKYSEVEIWATGDNYDETKPEYVAPQSKYNTLVWSDEFNGDQLDETKWQVIDGMNNFAAIYNPDAISVHDGYLDINSKNYGSREALQEAVEWDQYHDAQLPEDVTWSSGRIESKNKFSFQNGRVAVRAKVNDSQGIWPAIWMLCQDETGHDEIDILEYLGQDPWDAHTTNHYGILNKNKGSQSKATVGEEAWSQDFHVYEVEWDPQQIKFFIDGKEVLNATWGRDFCDGMHTRPMFLILETQVGGGWVGPVDSTGQRTKQSSSFLVDWVHVYQEEQQPVARFDDMANIHGGAGNDPYFTAPVSATAGLQEIHSKKGEQMPVWQDKDYFFYGGQPRVENDRVAIAENAEGEQSLIYRIPDAKDVHLTTYYQTLSDGNYKHGTDDWFTGRSIRKFMQNGQNIDFAIETSADGKTWTRFDGTKVVDNYIDAHPGYARATFDAYGLPDGTNYVKIVFPNLEGAQYALMSGDQMPVLNTDVQLAKVTFMQKKGASDDTVPSFTFAEEGKEPVEVLPFETVKLDAGTREGYAFEGWTVTEGNITLENAAQTSFVMPTEKVSVKANWKAIPYTIAVSESTAQQSGAGTYIVGDTVRLDAGTREGYNFEGWTVRKGSLTLKDASQRVIEFTMPAENLEFEANWNLVVLPEPENPEDDVKPDPENPENGVKPEPENPGNDNEPAQKPEENTKPESQQPAETAAPAQQRASAAADAPATGDATYLAGWLTVMLTAAGGAAFVLYRKRKNSNNA